MGKLKCALLVCFAGVAGFKLGQHWKTLVDRVLPLPEPNPEIVQPTTSGEEPSFVG